MKAAGPILAHLDHLRLLGRAETTVYDRKRQIARLVVFLGGTPLMEASAGDLMAWRKSLTVADETVTHYVTAVREFYRWAVAEGFLDGNPAAGLPSPGTRRRLPRPVSEDDLFMAVGNAPRRVRPWLVLAGWAGLRAKEIALLRRENVLDTAWPPVILVAGDATKGHRERAVPVSQFVLAELHACGLPRRGYVFRRRDGRIGPMAPHNVSHIANRYLHSVGVQHSLHSLRHRFGTEVYAETRDLRITQEALGHQNPSTTAGYAAYSRATMIDALEALPTPAWLSAPGRHSPKGSGPDVR